MVIKDELVISVSDAEKIILNSTKERPTVKVTIDKCLGLSLGEDIYARFEQPPFDRVAMDGIAICYEHAVMEKKEFPIEAVQAAGSPQLSLKETNNCLEVMTGAVLPEGANCVIPYEAIDIKNNIATINDEITLSNDKNIHKKGKDYKTGELILKKGVIINAPIKAILASQGSSQVLVYSSPKIAIISTGNELVELDQAIEQHQIFMSNSYAIEHELRAMNFNHTKRIHIRDSKEETEKILEQCLKGYDLIILTGGVSRGKFDFIPDSLDKLGVTKLFHKIKQKPGKPMWYGTLNEKQIFALPGNPVSCLTCLNRYVIPSIRHSIGANRSKSYAILAQDIAFKKDFALLKAVSIATNEQGQLIATPINTNNSGDFFSLGTSDGYLELPENEQTYSKGSVFPYFPWA